MVYLPNTVTGPLLDVEADIDPLHLYRPINTAQWTTLDGGDVSVLKDNGRGSTLDLTQSTAANRPGQGVDALGNSFMSFTQDDPNEQSVQGATAADWTFLNFPGPGGATIAAIVAVDDITADSIFFETAIQSIQHGVFGRVNARNGSSCTVFRTGGLVSMALASGGPVQSGAIGPVGIYSYVARYRDVDDINVPSDPESKVEAELSVCGTRLMVNQPRQNEFVNATPQRALSLGNTPQFADLGLRGKIYEAFFDNRYLSDELVRRYHNRGVDKFGAFKGILT